jgi:hypothetical protein
MSERAAELTCMGLCPVVILEDSVGRVGQI